MPPADSSSALEVPVTLERHLALAEPPAERPGAAPTDEELVAALLRGEAACASAFYRRVSPSAERALLRVFGCRDDDHEDLLQLALEQVVRSVIGRKFAGNCSLPTWAATIASRVGLVELRQRYRRRALFVPSGVEDSPTQDPPAHERIDLVRKALAQLNRERALVLFMHDTEGYSLREIAQTLNTSTAAAQSRLVRGRKQFVAVYDKLCSQAESQSGGQPA